MSSHLNYSGFVVAAVGFFLTRFTVTLAIYEDPTRFYLAGVLPLALGLGLAAFGVALAVADVDPALVRTTAAWCVVGAGTMFVLAVLTVIGSSGDLSMAPVSTRSRTYLSNFLIGGSVGGTLTGLYAARNRRQRRELERQADRLAVLNHMLRHKILNALTPIRGFAAVDPAENPSAVDVVERRSSDIEETVEEVRYFTDRTDRSRAPGVPTNVEACLQEAVASVESDHATVDVTIDSAAAGATVLADDRLSLVFTHLLENAVLHANDETPTVAVERRDGRVRVSVIDDGPGLPAAQRTLLETGTVDDRDRLDTGFGLDLVRLFAESYDTTIETAVDAAGSRVTLDLPAAATETDGLQAAHSARRGGRPAVAYLLVTLAASIVAGVVYGIVSETLGGSIAGIGVFYGTASPVVGWLTHEFHSVVFGFVFVALVSLVPGRYRDRVGTYLAVGLGWGVVLWLGAAGVVAPLWLQLVGIDAALPNLSGVLLVNHVAWGLTLGLLTAVGYRHLAPRLSRRLPGRTEPTAE